MTPEYFYLCVLTAINIIISSALRDNVSRAEPRSFAADSDSFGEQFRRPAGNYGPQLKQRLLILQVGCDTEGRSAGQPVDERPCSLPESSQDKEKRK